MLVKAKKSFSSPVFGNVTSGDGFDVEPHFVRQLLQYDLIEEVEISPLGKPQQLSALHPVQASQVNNAKSLENQDLEETLKPSESIQATKPQNATLSMRVTGGGGKNTTKKHQKTLKNGRVTN